MLLTFLSEVRTLAVRKQGQAREMRQRASWQALEYEHDGLDDTMACHLLRLQAETANISLAAWEEIEKRPLSILLIPWWMWFFDLLQQIAGKR